MKEGKYASTTVRKGSTYEMPIKESRTNERLQKETDRKEFNDQKGHETPSRKSGKKNLRRGSASRD